MVIAMRVIVYTTPICPYCILVKNFLKQNKVQFSEIDLSTNKRAAEEIVKKCGALSAPIIDVDGNIVVGYDTKKLKELLGL
jgi:glutaredoxin-like YruB-family protein